MPLSLVLLALPLVFLCAVAGGYGGLMLLARRLRRDLGEMGADLESFDLRIKKLEGRAVRATQGTSNGRVLPKELQELAAVLQHAPRPQIVPQQETEADIIARAFPGSPKKDAAG